MSSKTKAVEPDFQAEPGQPLSEGDAKPVEREPKPIVKTKDTRALKCQLTRDELLDYGQKLADAEQDLIDLEAELTSFKNTIKGKQTMAEGAIGRYGSVIRQRYEHRPVECETVLDYETETARATRLDTLEVIEDRKMDRQELERLPISQ